MYYIKLTARIWRLRSTSNKEKDLAFKGAKGLQQDVWYASYSLLVFKGAKGLQQDVRQASAQDGAFK